MFATPRHRSTVRRTVALVAVLASGSLAASLASSPLPAAATPDKPAVAAKKVKPGLDGAPIVLEDQGAFSGFDLATDQSTGTAYVGWISAPTVTPGLRQIHLCVLPPGATGCAGSVISIAPGDGASAAGIQVTVTSPGTVKLTWFYDQPGIGKIAQATYASGGVISTATVADAPDNGALLDAVLSPQGQLWTVVQDASTLGPQHLQVRNENAPVADLTAPYMVSKAALAFQGTQPVLVADKYGAIGEPVIFTSGPAWGAFQPVAKTWSLGGIEDLVGTSSGVRLVAAEDNAGYRPVVARWKGTAFGKPGLTGDKNSCAPASHDLVTDPSGRAADVANECGQLTLANLADTEHAGLAGFSAGGTISSGMPQLTTTQRGFGWVAWAILSPVSANRLLVAPIRLPALIVKKSDNSPGGKVTVQGPADCLPVVTAEAKVKANPAKGWRVVSSGLVLDGKDVGRSTLLHGEKATSGEKFKLVGTAVFAKGNARSTASQTLKLSAC